VVAGRSASALVSWVNDRHPTWRTNIRAAALDPYRGYASALRSVLGDAVRVLDAFHVIRLGFAAVDQVRCRIQREQTGHRGRTGDPLYRIRRLLRRGADHHTEPSWARCGGRAGCRRHPRRTTRPHLDRRPRAPADLPQSRQRPRRTGPLPLAELLRRRRHPRTHPVEHTIYSAPPTMPYVETIEDSTGQLVNDDRLSQLVARRYGFQDPHASFGCNADDFVIGVEYGVISCMRVSTFEAIVNGRLVVLIDAHPALSPHLQNRASLREPARHRHQTIC